MPMATALCLDARSGQPGDHCISANSEDAPHIGNERVCSLLHRTHDHVEQSLIDMYTRRLRYCTCVKAFKHEKNLRPFKLLEVSGSSYAPTRGPNTVLGSLSSTRLPSLLPPTYLRTWAPRRSPTKREVRTYARALMLFTVLRNIQGRCQRLPTSAPGVPSLSTTGSSTQTRTRTQHPLHPSHWHTRH